MNEELLNFSTQVAENLDIGILVLDRKGIVVHINSHMEKIFKIKESENLNRGVFSFYSELFPGVAEIGELIFESLLENKAMRKTIESPFDDRDASINIVASPLTVGGKSEGLIVGTNYTGNKSHRPKFDS